MDDKTQEIKFKYIFKATKAKRTNKQQQAQKTI